MIKKVLLFAVVLVIGLAPGIYMVVSKLKVDAAKPVEPKTYSCVAGENEMCPPQDWAADYKVFKDLNEKYKVPQKELDYINGLAARLRAAIPNGYQVDDKTGKWVKTPEPKK